MKVAFRTDASVQIGTGHAMRCLTLANALRERGAQCRFICRPHDGHLLDLIVQLGHEAIALPVCDAHFKAPADPAHAAWLGTDWAADAEQTRQVLGLQPLDWLVVDHYALDRRWEHALRQTCRHLMVIDDLADRPHDCNLLLDQNLGRSEQDYDGLLTRTTKTMIGPQYALLRPEFAQWREYSLARRAHPQLKNLLVTMGGVDKDNATGQVLNALKTSELPPDLHITIIMGSHAPWRATVQQQAAQIPWPTQILVGVTNMAQLMADSDLAIGAAGGTAWERCVVGLPSIAVVMAENQLDGAMALQQVGALLALLSSQDIQSHLSETLSGANTIRLQAAGAAAARVTDGCGGTKIVQRMLNCNV